MNFEVYTQFARTTAIYPDALTGKVPELLYLALGLSGEAGEVANKVKKLYRDGDSATSRERIVGELGDVFWYLVRICDALGVSAETVIGANAAKLCDRKERAKLSGSGDNR